jgi:hypothetical protein
MYRCTCTCAVASKQLHKRTGPRAPFYVRPESGSLDGVSQQGLQFTLFVHLGDDVAATDKLPLHP